MIVVDTNVIAFFWLPGDYTRKAKSLFRTESQWISPFLWRSEFRSILVLYMRKNLLLLTEAREIMSNAQKMMKGNEYSVDSFDILENVGKCNLSPYDLEFITLAESLDTKLVTLDKKVLAEFPTIAVSLDIF